MVRFSYLLTILYLICLCSYLNCFKDHSIPPRLFFPNSNQVMPRGFNKISWNLKRSNHFHSTTSSSCTCESKIQLYELGRKYFPKFLPVVECKSYTCSNMAFTCRAQYYTVKVLKRRSEGDAIEPDLRVPESLRNNWTCEEISIPVACHCVF